MDCSSLGSSVYGILQARILEWIAIPVSRGFSWPGDWIQVSYTEGRIFIIWATREYMRSLKQLSCFFPNGVSIRAINPLDYFQWHNLEKKNITFLTWKKSCNDWKFFLYSFKQKYCDLNSLSIWNRKTEKCSEQLIIQRQIITNVSQVLHWHVYCGLCWADSFFVIFKISFAKTWLYLMHKHRSYTSHKEEYHNTQLYQEIYVQKCTFSVSLCSQLSLESSVLVLHDVSWLLSHFHWSRY